MNFCKAPAAAKLTDNNNLVVITACSHADLEASLSAGPWQPAPPASSYGCAVWHGSQCNLSAHNKLHEYQWCQDCAFPGLMGARPCNACYFHMYIRLTHGTFMVCHLQEVAREPQQRPTLPRSGHAGAALPAWHDAQAIIFGGYTETQDKTRAATNEAWLFDTASGSWTPVQYAEGDVPVVGGSNIHAPSAVVLIVIGRGMQRARLVPRHRCCKHQAAEKQVPCIPCAQSNHTQVSARAIGNTHALLATGAHCHASSNSWRQPVADRGLGPHCARPRRFLERCVEAGPAKLQVDPSRVEGNGTLIMHMDVLCIAVMAPCLL